MRIMLYSGGRRRVSGAREGTLQKPSVSLLLFSHFYGFCFWSELACSAFLLYLIRSPACFFFIYVFFYLYSLSLEWCVLLRLVLLKHQSIIHCEGFTWTLLGVRLISPSFYLCHTVHQYASFHLKALHHSRLQAF